MFFRWKKDVLVIVLMCESNESKIQYYALIFYFSRGDSQYSGIDI